MIFTYYIISILILDLNHTIFRMIYVVEEVANPAMSGADGKRSQHRKNTFYSLPLIFSIM